MSKKTESVAGRKRRVTANPSVYPREAARMAANAARRSARPEAFAEPMAPGSQEGVPSDSGASSKELLYPALASQKEILCRSDVHSDEWVRAAATVYVLVHGMAHAARMLDVSPTALASCTELGLPTILADWMHRRVARHLMATSYMQSARKQHRLSDLIVQRARYHPDGSEERLPALCTYLGVDVKYIQYGKASPKVLEWIGAIAQKTRDLVLSVVTQHARRDDAYTKYTYWDMRTDP
jgi:hypothetical protein